MCTNRNLLIQRSHEIASYFTAGGFSEGDDERQVQAGDDEPGGLKEDLEDRPRVVLREGFQVSR
jgi:hypothetical protein